MKKISFLALTVFAAQMLSSAFASVKSKHNDNTTYGKKNSISISGSDTSAHTSQDQSKGIGTSNS